MITEAPLKESLTKAPSDHSPKKDNNSEHTQNNASFQLKGRLFTLSVIQIHDTGTKKLDKDLSEKIKLAPKFLNVLQL